MHCPFVEMIVLGRSYGLVGLVMFALWGLLLLSLDVSCFILGLELVIAYFKIG